ncbi:MAG: DUF1501 domain-containing protein [Planctomycetes bacterium]|nr:DUF1501 domain-containing protein [Planctomycetota bacterium]
MINRRIFLKDGALAVIGLSMVPGFVYRTALAAQPRLRKKTLVTVFQRGGVDGLNMVIPFGEKHYYDYRPTIAVPAPSKMRPSAIDLDGFFGLHPSLRPLHTIYERGELAIIPAAGSPHETRSHFAAQEYMETAAPEAEKLAEVDGWLNRYMHKNQHPEATSFRGVALGPVLPKSLEGDAPALAIGDAAGLKKVQSARSLFESMYDRETNALLSGTSREMFNAVDQLAELNPQTYEPANKAQYPNNEFGLAMKQLAQLIKADLGVEIAFVDIGGWDTHSNQGSLEGRLPQRLQIFANTLAAFYTDMGDRMGDIAVLTMSEFGRTARENGSSGTDHGKANVMFLMGGGVKGGAVYGDWPGLAPEQLNEDRDLAMTTDFRDVFAEVLVGHLDPENPEAVFPDFEIDKARFKNLMRS